MPSRYDYTKTLTTNETKKKYLESTIYPIIKPTDDDLYIIAQSNDRLDILALKYYGNKNYWWVIAVANNLNDASLYIETGMQIRIPSNISAINSELERINK